MDECEGREGVVFALGSSSSIKQEALCTALARCGIVAPSQHFPVVAYDVPSGVPPQPIGHRQTEVGATNRSIGALKHFLTATEHTLTPAGGHSTAQLVVSIGIENGMWPVGEPFNAGGDLLVSSADDIEDTSDSGGWEDGAAIVMHMYDLRSRGSDKKCATVWTDVLPIPPLATRPFPRSVDGCWSKLKDPHATLTNGSRPRSQFVADGLEAALKQVFCLPRQQ